nr:MBL fold metallo-hydrolase [Streptomyces sp. YIM 98790]
MDRIRRSPQFRDGAFRNDVPTVIGPGGSGFALFRELLFGPGRKRRYPASVPPTHTAALPGDPPAGGLRLTWLGHATVLAEIDGHRVLFDPVWGERCSPFGFAGPRRVHPVPLPLEALGPLDAVVISHDHYDHLDLPAIRALADSEAVFAVPLGVGAHLEHWGVPESRIHELDWHESVRVGELTLTATPSRHFCGRSLIRRSLTLWASWAVTGPDNRIFHSGDTGYFPGFAAIGARYGPFDATMMQIGAYSDYWPDIHMTPEEGLRAHRDLHGGVLLPIHWGTFNLALHPWDEPAERTADAAAASSVPVALPRPGEPFEPSGELPAERWWRPHARPPRRRPAASGSAGTQTRSGAGPGGATGEAQHREPCEHREHREPREPSPAER